MDIKFTNKQIEILTTIRKGNPDGSPCSVYDIMENLSYEVKRDALLHSIKLLVETGYIERKDRVLRGKRSVRVFFVTSKALDYI